VKQPRIPKYVTTLLKKNRRGIRLDLGCGSNKQEGFIGMDFRPIKGIVDIVHDVENPPYPLPDDSCSVVLASHLVEHLSQDIIFKVFNEIWRILHVGGQLLVACPYGVGHGFVQDPTHKNPFNESTFEYFDPDKPLFDVYRYCVPRGDEPLLPWRVVQVDIDPYRTGNMQAIMEKRPHDYQGQFSLKIKKGRDGKWRLV